MVTNTPHIKSTPKPSKITASTQAYLDIEEIKEGVIVLKDGSLRAVIYVSSLNFDLKSQSERESIVGSFQSFLNSLNFPIQIMINSKKIDLKEYIEGLEKLKNSQPNELLKLQTSEYVNFIKGLLDEINIMEKMFFVVVPHYPDVLAKNSLIGKFMGGTKKPEQTNFESDKIKLMDRVDVVVGGLQQVGLNCASLDTNGLIQLFYSLYNPDVSQVQKVEKPEDIETKVVQYGGLKNHEDADHLEI